ncbi:DNA repair protein endonuclease SAE2/CtIP C-terminus-domain-containing protein [Aspergillus recurvatus]
MEALQQLHSSLTQNIKSCFDTAYTGLNAELVAYNARVKDAEDRAQKADEARQRAVAEVNKLRHEISLLQEKLRQDEANAKEADKAAKSALRLDETYEPGRVFGNKEISDLDAVDVRRISDRYTELYQQAAIIIQASGNLRDLVKRHKTKVARLKALLQRQRPSPVLDGKALKPHLASTGPVTLLESPELPGSAVNPLKDPAGVLKTKVPCRSILTPTFEIAREQSSSIMSDACSGTSESRLQEGHPESISTPSDASTDELPPIDGASSNVEVETLKRKRVAPKKPGSKESSSSENISKADPTHPILVKGETLSSSPLVAHSPQPGPSGTQDLDDIGDTVVTPTKRIRFYKDQGYNITSENPPTTLKLASARHAPLRNHTARAGRDASSVLRPVDGNLQNPSAGQVANKKRTKNLGAIMRISSLTEDGEETRPLSWRRGIKSSQSDTNARDPSRVHRLSNLLEGASPTNRTLQSRVITNASATTPSRTSHMSGRDSPRMTGSETGATSITIPATSDFPQCNPKTRESEKDLDQLQHQSGHMNQTEAVPDEPYRARPPHRLGLEHFRINPEYNNGLDYAYDEVVRKRDERKYVSGCTRPGCCGEKFSAMARFGIPLNASGKAVSDREILEEYLGDDKNTIDTLSPEIRDNLLVEAKARDFANQFGKHRHQHHRSGTPPGFWRTEMPGTQQLEEDRAEARRLDRDRVQERYREAMRPGGLWRFADE